MQNTAKEAEPAAAGNCLLENCITHFDSLFEAFVLIHSLAKNRRACFSFFPFWEIEFNKLVMAMFILVSGKKMFVIVGMSYNIMVILYSTLTYLFEVEMIILSF